MHTKHTHMYKMRACGNSLYDPGSSVTTERDGMWWEVGGMFQRRGRLCA